MWRRSRGQGHLPPSHQPPSGSKETGQAWPPGRSGGEAEQLAWQRVLRSLWFRPGGQGWPSRSQLQLRTAGHRQLVTAWGGVSECMASLGAGSAALSHLAHPEAACPRLGTPPGPGTPVHQAPLAETPAHQLPRPTSLGHCLSLFQLALVYPLSPKSPSKS